MKTSPLCHSGGQLKYDYFFFASFPSRYSPMHVRRGHRRGVHHTPHPDSEGWLHWWFKSIDRSNLQWEFPKHSNKFFQTLQTSNGPRQTLQTSNGPMGDIPYVNV